MDNTILSKFTSTGASLATAGQDGLSVAGVPASEKLAAADRARVMRFKSRFEAAAQSLVLPPALLAGVASRESRGGAALDANGWGDHGNAFGIMQVDKRHHAVEGGGDPGSQGHISQAAGILRDNFGQIKAKHPTWPEERQLQGAVAAYNFGVGNVQTLGGIDGGTTGDDYSNDVWARARYFAGRWDEVG